MMSDVNIFNTSRILPHLCTEQTPFVLRYDGQPPRWEDEERHGAAYERDPKLYGLLAVAEGVVLSQRVRMLYQILGASRQGMGDERRELLERVTSFLFGVLPADEVLTVFLALRRVRANHNHTRRAILRYLLNHPQAEDLASHRRPAVVDSLEHAVGKNVARGCARFVGQGEMTEAESRYVRRHLLRYADDPERARRLLRFLYRQDRQARLEPVAESYKLTHQSYLEGLEREQELPKTVTATNRGDIAATLVHIYRGGSSGELTALETYIHEAASQLPYFEGKFACLLDASLSTQGYGEREYCIISQSVALQKVLERRCAHFALHLVGGVGDLPRPGGHTDFASALLNALADEPDIVAIISDGYENVYEGELGRLVETLPMIGIQTPVVFCHSKFTAKDDLTLRRPAPVMPQLEFWHQNDFRDMALTLFAMARGEENHSLADFLLQRLDELEKELPLWTSLS